MQSLLFNDAVMADEFRANLADAPRAVDEIDPEVLLDRTDEEVVAVLLDDNKITTLEIIWEKTSREGPRETRFDAGSRCERDREVLLPATEMFLHVPFVGHPRLLFCRPSRFTMNPPSADVRDRTMSLRIVDTDLTTEKTMARFEDFRRDVMTHVDAANGDVRQHLQQLEARFRQLVAERRARLLAQRSLAAALPFEIRPTSGSATYPIPVRRVKIHLTTPRPATPFAPEPALEDAKYEDILSRIVAFAHAVERTPISVGALDEEGLRDHLLVMLNTSYEGQAAGEVCNRSGKADIVLRSGDKHAFIAECKVWYSSKKFPEAVDQLLRYLVWRDSKAALILFIKTGKPTDVVRKANEAITAHAQFVRRFESADPTTRTDYLLRSTADPERMVRTALLPVAILGRTDRGTVPA